MLGIYFHASRLEGSGGAFHDIVWSKIEPLHKELLASSEVPTTLPPHEM